MTGNEKILAYIEKHGGVKNVDAAAKACGLTAGSFRTALCTLRAEGRISYPPRNITSITIVGTSSKAQLAAEADALLSSKPAPAKRSSAPRPARVAARSEPAAAPTLPTSDKIVLSAANLRAIADGARGLAALVDQLLASAPSFTAAIVQLANSAGPLAPMGRAAQNDEQEEEQDHAVAPRARRAPRRTPRPATKARSTTEAQPAPQPEPPQEEVEEDAAPKTAFRCLAEDGANIGEYLDLDTALRAYTRSSTVYSVVRIVDGHVVRTRAPSQKRGAAA